MKTERVGPPGDRNGRPFYRIVPTHDGLVDIWLTPGEAVPVIDLTGHIEFNIRVTAVRDIDPEDGKWGGALGKHITRHYDEWISRAEVMEF